ncbi:uncharacterized protein LOC128210682 [Mya arenaria]|uniref:uncharacterized protein LOC128210682 n=1 Tax=Mya arenaria TaxID=6604 RepID=UPI0022DEF733|nr:uncharacterized protein LOC128210682 [Mya arenaria]
MLELWEKVTPKLSEVSLEQPEAAAVYLSKEAGKITVVGMKHVADPLIKSIGAIIDLASDEFAKEKIFPVEKGTSIIVAAVKNFFREEQYSSLTEIYLCDMKYGTVDAFTEALQNEWGAHNVEKHASKTQQRKPDDSDEDAEHLYETLPAKAGPDPYSFGNIRVTIKSGDITAEDADCIVNSSNEDLDFNKG